MMRVSILGLSWAFAFVFIESVQFVYFGGLFQKMNSYLFGAGVFALSTFLFLGWSWITRPDQLRLALKRWPLVLKINVTATLAWLAFLGSLQFIEPAVAYTIGSGVMPLTVLAMSYLGVNGGAPVKGILTLTGLTIVSVALAILCAATIGGNTGFVAKVPNAAPIGVMLAIADGVFFTLLLAYCGQLSGIGVGAGTVFALRFPLYVLVAGTLFALGFGRENDFASTGAVLFILIGFALVVPPLYALQRAVDLVSTLTLSLMIATGPFIIFVIQMMEGRVAQSGMTLAGLILYFVGATLMAYGKFREPVRAQA